MQNLGKRLLRRKVISAGSVLDTPLKRCLTTFDLSFLGVGYMVGAGIYVLTGAVMRNTAGPSMMISFLLAGFAALLSALCYAEFGARIPKAGSAYSYTYVGCGEVWAFIIGWNIVLEYMLSAAAVARSFSGYLNALANNAISEFTLSIFGEFGKKGSLIAQYPDFVAVFIILLATAIVMLGPKAATNCNSFFALSNLLAMTLMVVYGSTFADFNNWTGTDAKGNSRFVPYGWNGMLAGAASCFFSYLGFDGLATAGEEAKDPSKAIPRATFYSMAITTTAYVLMSGVLSLMQPYEEIESTAPFSVAFNVHGAHWFAHVASVGAMFAMSTSLLGCVFALPRAVYAMAADGLLFEFWARVNERTRMPLNSAITFGLLTALTALLFDLDALVDFLSIGTLLAYSIVCASVIILRYKPANYTQSRVDFIDIPNDKSGRLRYRIPIISDWEAKWPASRLVLLFLFLMIACFAVLGILLSMNAIQTVIGKIAIIFTALVGAGSCFIIFLHQENSAEIPFKVAFIPFLPSAGLLVNILMMTHLSLLTWARLAFWMAIGFAIYLLYGIRHSKEEHDGHRVHPEESLKELKGREETVG